MAYRYFLRYDQFDPQDFEAMDGVKVTRDFVCPRDPTGTLGFLVESDECLDDQIA